MHLVSIIIAVAIVITGIYFSQKNGTEVGEEKEINSRVLSVEDELDASEESTPTVASDQFENSSPSQRLSEPEATNTPTPASASLNLSEYQYPNSQVVSSTGNTLILNSTDDTDKITDWYKDKINSEGMNVRTFVKTKTNDNVLNKLVGADGNKEISVEISKENVASSVNISVTIIEK